MSKKTAKYLECCLYFTANSLARHINRMAEEAFAPVGLSPSYAYLMLLVNERPGLTQNQLSREMNLQPSTMTRFVDKLEVRGVLKREQEGKTTRIYPTKTGQRLEKDIIKALKTLYDRYCEELGEEFAVKITADIHRANALMAPE